MLFISRISDGREFHKKGKKGAATPKERKPWHFRLYDFDNNSILDDERSGREGQYFQSYKV